MRRVERPQVELGADRPVRAASKREVAARLGARYTTPATTDSPPFASITVSGDISSSLRAYISV